MSVLKPHFPNLTSLGDANPFVERMREILDHIKLFEDFEGTDLETMARYMSCYLAPSGTEIIREGALGDFMLLIIEGSVEIVKLDSSGLPTRIGMAGPGKTLGEMSLIDGEPRFASCVAVVDTLFAVLDREGLSRIIADEPRIGVKLMMELLMLLNQRLRNVSTELVKLVMAASKYPTIVEASGSSTVKIHLKKKWLVIRNTNPIIGKRHNFLVSKTGYIRASGGCIVMMLDTDIGRRIVVVLGSKNTHTRIPEAEFIAESY